MNSIIAKRIAAFASIADTQRRAAVAQRHHEQLRNILFTMRAMTLGFPIW